jgi:hypothetical protein
MDRSCLLAYLLNQLRFGDLLHQLCPGLYKGLHLCIPSTCVSVALPEKQKEG